MKSNKKARNITINDELYKWRAAGNDNNISITIWPSNNIGATIFSSLWYYETSVCNNDGTYSGLNNQIVVTNKIVKRIIEYAIAQCNYQPDIKQNDLNLGSMDDKIELVDALRANEV